MDNCDGAFDHGRFDQSGAKRRSRRDLGPVPRPWKKITNTDCIPRANRPSRLKEKRRLTSAKNAWLKLHNRYATILRTGNCGTSETVTSAQRFCPCSCADAFTVDGLTRSNSSSRPSAWLYRGFLTLIQCGDGFSVAR